jgi:hypothetical protein
MKIHKPTQWWANELHWLLAFKKSSTARKMLRQELLNDFWSDELKHPRTLVITDR